MHVPRAVGIPNNLDLRRAVLTRDDRVRGLRCDVRPSVSPRRFRCCSGGCRGPWNPDQRPGDNKWTSGIFARDADTGEARWFYQFSPHDLYDYDAVNENLLLTLTIGGQSRPVIVRPERNGYIYVLDRTTGEVLSATPFVHITSSSGVDLKTGRLQYNEQKRTQAGVVVRDICPAAPGAKD